MQVPRTLGNAAKHYLAGFLASAFNGGVAAASGIIGIDGASISGLSSQARVLNAHEMIAGFLGACAVHGLLWLKAHPLPETFDTATPFMAQVTAPPSQKPNDPPT